MLTKINGRGISRSLSKEQNTSIVHCTLAVLHAERRGNHSFHFHCHMGNISILFLHSALVHVTLGPPKQKTPPCLIISWWLASVTLFKLFCFLVSVALFELFFFWLVWHCLNYSALAALPALYLHI